MDKTACDRSNQTCVKEAIAARRRKQHVSQPSKPRTLRCALHLAKELARRAVVSRAQAHKGVKSLSTLGQAPAGGGAEIEIAPQHSNHIEHRGSPVTSRRKICPVSSLTNLDRNPMFCRVRGKPNECEHCVSTDDCNALPLVARHRFRRRDALSLPPTLPTLRLWRECVRVMGSACTL